jgi:hypothetical protein
LRSIETLIEFYDFFLKPIELINPKIIVKTVKIMLEGLKAFEYYQLKLKTLLRKFSTGINVVCAAFIIERVQISSSCRRESRIN